MGIAYHHNFEREYTSSLERGQGEALSLYELNSLVRQTIEHTLNREYWVEAELAEARESRGHCYMELVQKEKGSNTPIARASAKCWRSQWMMIQPHFEHITGQRLHAGMKVRMKVYAQFHEAYGFSWIVTDIDPNFTLGDLARRRQEIIRQLKQEGVFDLQRELTLPLFCLRIAVISSETAAGYGDFCRQLSESGFAFETQLFPAVMQGEQVEESIIAALNRIYQTENGELRVERYSQTENGELRVERYGYLEASKTNHTSQLSTLNSQLENASQLSTLNSQLENASQLEKFDCVVIIRGGGATADMSGFDTLALAENVAQFPLPIITGIGHDRDECILDMVSHLRVKTPTAAAAFLIDHAQKVLDRIDDCQQRITHEALYLISSLKSQLSSLAIRIPTLFSLVKTHEEARLEQARQRIISSIKRQQEREHDQLSTLHYQLSTLSSRLIETQKHRLDLLQQRTVSLDPQLILNRGYSITTYNGKAVSNAMLLKSGDEIETRLSEGIIKSVVK